MGLLETLGPYLAWELTRWEVYGLFFLLGSFVVASLSDLKHLAAQREFMDVWWGFAAVLLVLDLTHVNWQPEGPFFAKWLLIGGLSATSHQRVGGLFRLATADVAACAAAASLLSPLLVVLFYGALKVLSYPLGSVLSRGRNVYPFLPVVTLGTACILALAATLTPTHF